MNSRPYRYRLCNTAWSGVVGKRDADHPDAEPQISFEEMLRMTVAAQYNGRGFSHLDMILLPEHVDLSKSAKAEGRRIGRLVSPTGIKIRSIVPCIWAGSAMDEGSKREAFVSSFDYALAFSEGLIAENARDRGDGVSS